MSEQTKQERYLHEHRAWNWQWPDEHNRWDTGNGTNRGPSMAYSGPGKRTVAKRAARRAGKRAH